jgi:hypothetical protein
MIDTELIIDISKKFNIDYKILYEFVADKTSQNVKDIENETYNNIILPFCGFIYTNKCKAVVYNHGLYTQCTNDSETFCNKCKNNCLKYGNIEDRSKFELGKFVTNDKKEIDYNKFIKKMKYNISDVLQALRKNNLEYKLLDCSSEKKGRGRPKKQIKNLEIPDKEESDEEIEVEKVNIDGIEYYQTAENVLLDMKTHDIIGINVNNKIKMIEKSDK